MLLKNKKSLISYILPGINSILLSFTYILFQRYITGDSQANLFSFSRIVMFFGIFVCTFLLFLICSLGDKHNKLEKIVQKISCHPMFTVLCAVAIFRLIYRGYFLNSTVYYDTKTYTTYPYNIFLGETDIFRTPGYPYFLKVIGKAVSIITNSNIFYNTVALVQSLLSMFSVVLIYLTGKMVFKSKNISVATALIYGVLPCVFNYDSCILTESLSLFCMVLFIYLVFSFLEKPKMIKAIILGVYSFVMIMIRPTFVYILPVLAVFFISRFIFVSADRKKCIAGILSVALSGLMLLGYCGLNYKNYDYFKISSVSVTVNQLKIVMDNGWQENKDYSEISTYVSSQMKTIDSSLWIPNIVEKLPNVYSYKEIDNYVSDCISKHKEDFNDYNRKKIISLSNQPIATQYSAYKTMYKDSLFSEFSNWFVTFSFPFTFLQCILTVILALFYAVVVLIRKRKICWQVVGLSAIIFSHIFVSVYGSMAEFARLSAMAIPALVLLVFYFFDLFLSVIRKYNFDDKNYSKIKIKKEVEQ